MRGFMVWMMVGMTGMLAFGCGGEVTQPSPQEYGMAKFAVPIPKLLVNTLTRVEGVVTAADIDTLRKDLTIGADDVARGVITGILVGDDRKVTLNGYRSNGVLTHSGYADGLTITAGDTLDVEIVLLPITGAVSVNGIIGQVTGKEATFTLPGGATMEMVWIEPGTFTMGSPSSEPGREDDEGPQHEVTITKGFWLGKFEITQGQWQSVMGTTPWKGQSYVQENPNNAASYISWDDAQEFIAKLNAEGSEVYRLPREAEWEYACRAGTTKRWSFGDDESQLTDYAWYRANAYDVGEEYAHEVGTKLPNPWGLHDMHGNVREWCQDWFGSYSSSAQTDPLGPASGSARVVRGVHFTDYARNVRSAKRYSLSPGFRGDSEGARLLRQSH